MGFSNYECGFDWINNKEAFLYEDGTDVFKAILYVGFKGLPIRIILRKETTKNCPGYKAMNLIGHLFILTTSGLLY